MNITQNDAELLGRLSGGFSYCLKEDATLDVNGRFKARVLRQNADDLRELVNRISAPADPAPPAPGPVTIPFPVIQEALGAGIRTLFTPRLKVATMFAVPTVPGNTAVDVSMAEHGGEPTHRRMWVGHDASDGSNIAVEGLASSGTTPQVVLTLDGSKGFKAGDTVYVFHLYERDFDGSGQAKVEASAIDVKHYNPIT